MDKTWREILWRQFEATLDMFEKALRSCPDELWNIRMWKDPEMGDAFSEFWYVAYHTLFWLDLYLSGTVEGFNPPEPFTLAELDPTGLLPERPYTREELLDYLEHCRQKCRKTIDGLSNEKTKQKCSFAWGQISFGGLLLDNMRHVQEHGAQLNMILGQKTGYTPGWIGQ